MSDSGFNLIALFSDNEIALTQNRFSDQRLVHARASARTWDGNAGGTDVDTHILRRLVNASVGLE